MLVAVIKDALLRMNLTLSKVRGQCYDGVANMAGARLKVAKKIADEEPRAIYIRIAMGMPLSSMWGYN